jgi:hypothetical protein
MTQLFMQPAPGPPGYQGPPYYLPPPRPNSPRTALIATLIVALVVLLAGGGIVVKLLSGHNAPPVATGPTTPPTSTAQPTPTAEPTTPQPTHSSPTTLVGPATIGPLQKSADQSAADSMKNSLNSQAALFDSTFAVEYDDTGHLGRLVALFGGTGALFQSDSTVAESAFDGFFSGLSKDFPNGDIGTRYTVAPGAIGGQSECETVADAGVSYVFCAYLGRSVLLGMFFIGYPRSDADALVPQILNAVVIYTG